MLKKTAFTLAEVLITLGIIGVVAAMTIPGLMTNLQHKHTAAKLKKFYSTMKQVILQAEEEFGPVGDWEKTKDYTTFAQTYLAPYMKFTISNVDNNVYLDLLDGTIMYFYKGGCLDIVIDINGWSNPNKSGYDRFRFLACDDSNGWCGESSNFCTYKTNALVKSNSRASYYNKCKSSPAYCSALIEYDGWTFQSDYPYK